MADNILKHLLNYGYHKLLEVLGKLGETEGSMNHLQHVQPNTGIGGWLTAEVHLGITELAIDDAQQQIYKIRMHFLEEVMDALACMGI